MRLPFFICVLLLVLASVAQSQNRGATGAAESSVIVVQRRVVLTRALKLAREFPDRKTAVVRYPSVAGLSNAAVLRKIHNVLAVKNVFGSTLQEYQEEAWLIDFGYKVNYNRNHLLDITFSQSGMGAYPDTQTKHFLINLKNGEVIKATDTFDSNKLTMLSALVDERLQSEVRTIVQRFGRDQDLTADEKNSLKDSFAELKFKVENLDEFSVSNQGITFWYDAGFPHVSEALQPEGRYFFAYSKLQPYIKQQGPLGVFRAGKLK
jgi:hypothetical protein